MGDAVINKWFDELHDKEPLASRGGGMLPFLEFVQDPGNLFIDLGGQGLLVLENIPSGVAYVHVYLWAKPGEIWAKAFAYPEWLQAVMAWAFEEFKGLRKFVIFCSSPRVYERALAARFVLEGTLRDQPAGEDGWYCGYLRRDQNLSPEAQEALLVIRRIA